MEDLTLLIVDGGYPIIFETIEEFQTYMNEHYSSYWNYQIYNCILREDNNTPINERCW